MKLPINIAIKLQAMLDGDEFSSSSLKQPIILKMVEDGIIQTKFISNTKRNYFIANKDNLQNYLATDFGIKDLTAYIAQINHRDLSRSSAIEIASNSKLKPIRTFKGFMVNCYDPITVLINNNKTILQPTDGTFIFIYDFESFIIPKNVTVVGIENPENFRFIHQQSHLFKHIKPIFVSRYPQTQSKDLIKWLTKIPNNYLHFGDFDFEGVNIFFNEYKKYLGEKAYFFIPENIETLLKKHGNANIYNTQIYKQPKLENIKDDELKTLICLIHQYKKGLEQEIFINLK